MLAGKENKLVKGQEWKKHFDDATWKKNRGLVKGQKESQYLNSQS